MTTGIVQFFLQFMTQLVEKYPHHKMPAVQEKQALEVLPMLLPHLRKDAQVRKALPQLAAEPPVQTVPVTIQALTGHRHRILLLMSASCF
jgi:hypothetical protein